MVSKRSMAFMAIDTLSCILLVVYVLIAPPNPTRPAPPMEGKYVITTTWAASSNNDIDLWVEDPDGNICYFSQSSIGLMHLEHDDLGTKVSESQILPNGQKVVIIYNGERTVLRDTIPGEYTVNVVAYQSDHPERVTIKLWRVRGAKLVTQRMVVLPSSGDEATAFRFVVDNQGNIVSINHLPKSLTKQTY